MYIAGGRPTAGYVRFLRPFPGMAFDKDSVVIIQEGDHIGSLLRHIWILVIAEDGASAGGFGLLLARSLVGGLAAENARDGRESLGRLRQALDGHPAEGSR